MRVLSRLLFAACVALVVAGAVLLGQVASAPPPPPEPRDVFGFARLEAVPEAARPGIRRFAARDGEALAYRLYESASPRLLVFVHGSSYHGGGYHALARDLAERGAARVVLPNLRGHHLSGPRRGDVDYLGQLEDDVADLIAALRADGHDGPVHLGGHSSGGGFAIRFAGGPHADEVEGYLLLAPVVPTSSSLRGAGSAGGWANLHRRRLIGLVVLNLLGVHGFDALPVIEFNKPVGLRDGTETLAYSHRLNASYHPRADYGRDLAALPGSTLVLVGEEDEAVDPEALAALFAEHAPGVAVEVLAGVDHLGIHGHPRALARCAAWLGAPAGGPAR